MHKMSLMAYAINKARLLCLSLRLTTLVHINPTNTNLQIFFSFHHLPSTDTGYGLKYTEHQYRTHLMSCVCFFNIEKKKKSVKFQNIPSVLFIAAILNTKKKPD